LITILAVGAAAAELAAFGSGHPSVEVVAAANAEDALDRLARNRRIDAVLLLSEAGARAAVRLFQDEDPGGPPIFGACDAPGVIRIDSGAPETMLVAVIERVSSAS
jgi:hypothetical protein